MFPNSPSARLSLLKITNKVDEIGNQKLVIESSKEVVASVKSITSKEYLSSSYLNIKYDLKVVVNSFLFDGSKYVKYNGSFYKIERTYINGIFIELYLIETSLNI